MTLLKNVIATLAGPLMLTVGVPALIVALGGASLPAGLRGWQIAGMVVTTGGLGIACWCMWAFIFIGRGMPTSADPPKVLVARGLYRRIRNPMYSGVLLIIAGEALLLESLLVGMWFGLAWLGLHAFVVLYEEPSMRRRFGRSYDDYCRATPRWLPIPRQNA